MTIQECIDYVDSIEPNAYSDTQKAAWLNECEGKVYTQLFLVQPYEYKTVTQDLALPAPYDRMYSRYLQAMIHYADGEYNRYQNSYAMFNEVWAEANRWFGGDFDVTDRLRNRSFQVSISTDDQTIMDIPEGCSVVAGRMLVKGFTAAGALTAQLSMKGVTICTIDLTADGVTPLPMLTADRSGAALEIEITGAATQEGTMTLTGRLLIPDERWHYDPAYARRRDARWHG